MAPLRSYRPVALLAVCALLLSAFAPVAAPCVTEGAPAPKPCHEGMGGPAADHAAHPDAPSPESPSLPRAAMPCCNVAAVAAPALRADVTLVAVAAVTVPALVQTPSPSPAVVAPASSPPRGHPLPLSILYGCFLN